jgi:heat shock protein HslJ
MLMAQERVFLEVLRGIQRFELVEGGVLLLHGADGGTITARRE